MDTRPHFIRPSVRNQLRGPQQGQSPPPPDHRGRTAHLFGHVEPRGTETPVPRRRVPIRQLVPCSRQRNHSSPRPVSPRLAPLLPAIRPTSRSAGRPRRFPRCHRHAPAMTGPAHPARPSGHTSPCPGGPTHTITFGGGAGWAELPLVKAVYVPIDLWPPYAFDVREACGIRWNWLDIRRFLDKTEQSGNCLIWKGAKSRGQGNTQWYGSFTTQGKTVRAHKFYSVAVIGLRPGEGEELDHECDVSLCCHCRVLTKDQNRDRIRRPTARVLELARFCGMSAAEILHLPPDRIEALARLMDVAKQIEAGRVPPGVMVDYQRRKPH